MSKRGVRDRVVELVRVRAGELIEPPSNWRRHPKRQRAALAAMLSEVAYYADGTYRARNPHMREPPRRSE